MNHIAEAFAETFGGPPEKDPFLAKLIVAGVLVAGILALAAYGALHLMGAV
jgi:hypothetical protein